LSKVGDTRIHGGGDFYDRQQGRRTEQPRPQLAQGVESGKRRLSADNQDSGGDQLPESHGSRRHWLHPLTTDLLPAFREEWWDGQQAPTRQPFALWGQGRS